MANIILYYTTRTIATFIISSLLLNVPCKSAIPPSNNSIPSPLQKVINQFKNCTIVLVSPQSGNNSTLHNSTIGPNFHLYSDEISTPIIIIGNQYIAQNTGYRIILALSLTRNFRTQNFRIQHLPLELELECVSDEEIKSEPGTRIRTREVGVKISRYRSIDFCKAPIIATFALRKNVSSFVLNSDSYFQLHEIYPITISFDEWDGDQEIVGKEAYYSAPAKRYSLQKIKLFITFTFTVRELCYVITKSGHIIGVNHNVLFYNISPLKHTASGETVNQITKLGITCPLTFITVTSHSIDSKW
ncbi:hypothetical protein Fcan01_18983 [Folsomia candida]|uniref:Uncharacterized protein n=1 Tax=Folsomia candida TaxID=158441 RepID=A0A226DKN1_FOLCA|nr:hypothetical protein Fcan01_18983 [Folsomia candida]